MNKCIDRLRMTDAAILTIRATPEAAIAKPWKMPVSCLGDWQLGISVAVRMGSVITLTGYLATTLLNSPVLAQIIPDTTLGTEGSVITPNAQIRELPAELIQGGATRGTNLFHSFQEFNVGNGQGVYFANPTGIENILTRVTGNNLSNILGTLGVDGGANLFLLNPNGIIFGANARLDIAGSFVASTADSLVFNNGYQFSAKNPEEPPLLTISLTPGLQYGTNQPRATITNSGNLTVGQNLTLSAGNLDLQGQLQAEGDLTLFAQDLVKVRDSVTNPFVASSGGQLLVQGNHIDIFALNHPNSGLFSAEDMVLRSANTIGGDAHYWSGGSFRIEKLDGTLGNLDSPHDPIILADGDVSLGDYTGASLHILAGGSVTLGNVEITGTDSGGNTINPNNSDPFLASLATVLLSDGTTLTIDGSVKSTLDVRAGIDWTTFPQGSPGNRTFGTVDPTPTPVFGGVTSANITVNGEINVSQAGSLNPLKPEGFVLLTNQYRPNGLAGSISTQGIDTSAIRAYIDIDAGTITINSRGNITTNGLGSSNWGYANGGAITLHAANGNITTGGISSYTNIDAVSGNGGDIKLTAINGNITVAGGIRSSSRGNSSTGRGGLVTLTATGSTPNTGNITVEGGIDTTSFSNYGGIPWVKARMSEGGDVILSADNVIKVGAINTAGNAADETNYNYGNINLTANEIYLEEGRGKTITLTAGNSITTDFLDSSSFKNNGGTINLTAGGDITVGFLDSSFFGDGTGKGNGGAINITSREGTILAKDGAINSTTFGTGNAGNINIQAPTVYLVNTPVTSTVSGVGSSGSISILANDSIFMDRSRLFTSVDPGTTGTGGNITLEAKSVFLNNFSFIDTATFSQGDAGNVLVKAEDLVLRGQSSIFSITAGQGNAGKVTLQGRAHRLAPNITLTNRSSISTAVNSTAQGNGGDITLNARSLNITGGSQLQALTRGEGDAANNRGNSGNIAIAADSIKISGISADGFLSGVFTSTDAANSGKGGTINITTPGTLLVADGAVLSAQTASIFNGGDIFVQANQVELRNGGQFLTSTTSSGKAGNITVEATENVIISGTDPNFNNRVSPSTLVPTCAVAGIACGISTNPNVEFSSKIPYVSISATGKGETDIYTFEVPAGTRAIFDIDNGLKYTTPDSYGETPQSVNTFISLLDSQGNKLRTNEDALVSLGEGGSTETQTMRGKLILSQDSYFRYVFTEPGRYSIQVDEGDTGVKVGGTYTLQVSLDTPNVTGSVIDANPASGLFARTQGAGAAGGITINTPQFTLQDAAQISASTSGAGKGGSVTVRAPESITLSGNSTLSATADVSSSGIAGDVLLTTPQLTVTNGARVSASTNSTSKTATGGNLTVQSSQVNLTGGSSLSAGTTGAAPGGNLTIQPFANESTLNVNLQDGSVVSASTSGAGKGGTLTVRAPESVTISGNGILSATADASSTGIAGDVLLTTPQLTVTNGARVSASTNSLNSSATGGNLTIQAEQLNLTGKSTIDAGTTGAALGGNLLIQPLGESPTLSVNFQDGSIASASSSGSGKGGTLTVSAPESITVSGNGSFISAETSGSGAGGDLNLNTGDLTVRDGAKVTVSSSGTGNAGNLNVNANNVYLDNGKLIAETASGEGGNINLNVKDLVLMRYNSEISTEARGTGNGGNININAGVAILAILSENNDIVANAYQGQGGNITANAPLIRTFRQFEKTRGRTPESDFIASSELGIDGSVRFSPQTNIEESLPINFVDQSEQIDRRCTPDAAKQHGSFTITGRGGLPPSPNNTLQAESLITNWVTLDSQQDKNRSSAHTMPNRSAPKPLTEAQGWMINQNGEVVLTASASQVTPQGEWLPTPECNPPQTVTLPQS